MKPNAKTVRQRSKFLSLVLRHQPASIGIQLDREGWTNIEILLIQMSKHRQKMSFGELLYVVENNDKKRFQFSDDGQKIRAVQGHSSTQVQRDYLPLTPPDPLYHGTATRFVDSILQQGLIAGSRHHVHLSADLVTATKVGQRHGKVLIFRIDTIKMQQDGYSFFQAENGVWLTEHVPTHYLTQIID